MDSPDVDTVLEHLREVAKVKRRLLDIAVAVQVEHPAEAYDLLGMIRSLTLSANTLLGDAA